MIFTFDIGVFFQPTAPAIDPLQLCDDASNDGVEVFDLSTFESTILEPNVLAGQDPLDFSITFHNTQSGANTNTNGITPITEVSLSDEDSVFVRIENINNTSCFETTEIVFTVSAVPFANNVSNQVVCDDPSNDGVEAFDLTTLETDILGTQSASDFSITFHTTQVGADTNTGNITPATSAMITDNGSVFARIENSTNSSCFDTTEITFTLNESPVANPVSTQTACGDSTSGMASFDLSSFETTVLGAQTATDFTITFHNSQSDANADANAISNTTNVSLGNNDSVFVRIVNNSNLCFDTTEISFSIGVQPLASPALNLDMCDDLSNDGVGSFNLDSQDSDIFGTQTDLLISYHESLEDAESGMNSILDTSNYTNTTNPQTIFARVINQSNTDCFDVTSFNIEVLPVADITVFESIGNCDEGFGISTFNLTSNPDVLDIISDNEDNVIEGYFTSLEDAENQDNEISDPSAFQNSIINSQDVFVRFQRATSSCFEIGQISLVVENCDPFIPEGFSPNGDGINDIFEITGLRNIFENYELNIYSRLGNLIYEGNNEVDFWDGTPNEGIGGGDPLPTGVYFWTLQFNDGSTSDQSGWVYLNR